MTADRRDLRLAVEPGETEVSAIVLSPPGARALLALGHGAGAGMRHRFMEGIAEALAAQGVASLRYQFPYVEEGRRRPDRAGRLVSTVRAAVREARAVFPDLRLFAGGKSMGGRMTSIAQAEEPLPGVAGIVFLGFPLHRPGNSSDARSDHLDEVGVPLLFIQGTRDRLAERERIERVVSRLGERATLQLIEDADHGFDVPKRTGLSSTQVYAEMAGAVADWLNSVP